MRPDRRGLHRGQPGLRQRLRQRGRGRRHRRLLGQHRPPERDPAPGRPRCGLHARRDHRRGRAVQPARRPRRHRGQRRGRHGARATTPSSTATWRRHGAWITIVGAGHAGAGELDGPNPEPARGPLRHRTSCAATSPRRRRQRRRRLRQRLRPRRPRQDDVYGRSATTGSRATRTRTRSSATWARSSTTARRRRPVDPPDPPQQFIVPNQPFLGATINQTGVLKREVTLYAFNESRATAGIGHDVALGGDGNDWIHTGPGEDLANGNAGDDRIWLGDNFTATTAVKTEAQTPARARPRRRRLGRPRLRPRLGRLRRRLPRRPAAQVGGGARPLPDERSGDVVPGCRRRSDGASRRRRRRSSHNGVNYAHGDDNFGDNDYHLRRLGSGHAAGERRRQRAAHRRPPARLGRQLQRLLPLPVDLRRLGLDAGVAPGLIAFLQQMSQGDGATTTATAGQLRLPRDGDRLPERARQETRSRSTPTRPPTSPAGPGTAIP